MTADERTKAALGHWESVPREHRVVIRDLHRLEDDLAREPDPHLSLGVDLALLGVAKSDGWDFVLHSSWCSNQLVFVLRLRAPGQAPHAARTRVGEMADVLRWGANVVEAEEGVR